MEHRASWNHLFEEDGYVLLKASGRKDSLFEPYAIPLGPHQEGMRPSKRVRLIASGDHDGVEYDTLERPTNVVPPTSDCTAPGSFEVIFGQLRTYDGDRVNLEKKFDAASELPDTVPRLLKNPQRSFGLLRRFSDAWIYKAIEYCKDRLDLFRRECAGAARRLDGEDFNAKCRRIAVESGETNDENQFPVFFYRFDDDGDPIVFSLGDLKGEVKHDVVSFSDAVPFTAHRDDPTTGRIGSVRQELKLKRDEDMRFRLHLLRSARTRASGDEMDELLVDPEQADRFDSLLDFDAASKAFEHDLEARSMDGFQKEFCTVAKLVLGMLFSKTYQPRLEDLKRTGVVELDINHGNGLVPVPFTPWMVGIFPDDSLVLPVYSAEEHYLCKSFPRWQNSSVPTATPDVDPTATPDVDPTATPDVDPTATSAVDPDDHVGVSSASLFLWRNIVSKLAYPGHDDALAKHNVAMLITNLNSFGFDPSSEKEHGVIDGILNILCKKMKETLQLCSEGKSPTVLHLVQTIDAAVVPGSGVSLQQPFAPLRVTFPSAASTGLGEVEYTLGSESSDVFEALQIAVALLYSQGYNHDRKADVDEQETGMTIGKHRFSVAPKHDVDFKRDNALRDQKLLDLYCTYGRDQHEDSAIDFDKYCEFLGFDDQQHNKSGHFIFCRRLPAEILEEPIETITCGTGRLNFIEIQMPETTSNLEISVIHSADGDLPQFDNCLNDALKGLLNGGGRRTRDMYLPLERRYDKDNTIRVGFVWCVVDRQETGIDGEERTLVLNRIKGVILLMPNLMNMVQSDIDGNREIRFHEAVHIQNCNVDLHNGPNLLLDAKGINQWDVSLKAYQSYRKSSHPLIYHTEQAEISTDDFVSQMISGFQGFHFSNMRALRRTVFAVAANKTRNKLWKWYTSRQSGVHSEPRGVHLECPEQRDVADAELMRLLKDKRRGKQDLVTAVVVLVRGPGLNALETPCVLENVFAKTSLFRRIEGGVFTRLLTRMECTRGLPKGTRPNCLAVHLRKCQAAGRSIRRLRQIVEYNVRFAPTLANLVLRLRDYESVLENTDKSRNTQAMSHSVAEIQDSVFNLLYLT